ncbi:MAG TPA: phosphate/phosphite/phosphonate ABC transporter substrate-binding protein [Candidatus Ozemobacteraceae bacterium]|nr:phosphate/phosphite/phosphonate ABC transporter substrate-binding protein [Candidatus Ozemobacteraceae bacterium]
MNASRDLSLVRRGRAVVWVTLLILLIVAGVLAWQPRHRLVPVTLRIDPKPPVVFGVIPFLGPRELKARMEPLLSYLSRKLQRPVRLNVAADYETLARLLDEKRAEIAWFSHASLQHLGYAKPWSVICRPVQGGRIDYFGKIIVRADSPFQAVADLKGRTFAYVERNSGSGFYFPNRLFASLNIYPLDYFGRVVFTHSHDSSIDGVIKGLYDGAAVYTITPDRKSASMAEQLRYVATTGPIPYDPLVIRNDLPPALLASISDALLTMHLDPTARNELASLTEWRNIDRFAAEEEVQRLLAGQPATASDAVAPSSPLPITATETPHD